MTEQKKRDFLIRPLKDGDFPQIQAIYEMGLESGHATYERKAPTWEHFSGAKIMDTVFVAVEEDNHDEVIGWVSAAPASSRQVFHGVVEDSVYVHPQKSGRGIAGALLDRLIEKCIELDKWVIHSWIFPENTGSIRLHTSRGFELVGTMSHLAKMEYGELAGQRRDTQIYEKLLPKPDNPNAGAAIN